MTDVQEPVTDVKDKTESPQEHPMGFSRSGMPTQYEPWHADWAAGGNGFEVDLGVR
jgi:hypothetical protein